MVQINLRKDNYDKAIRRGVKDINAWINKIAEKELSIQEVCIQPSEPCAVDISQRGNPQKKEGGV